MGLGLYRITPDLKRGPTKDMKPNDTTRRTLEMKYFTFFWNYDLLHKKNWSLGFPVEYGFGKYDLTVTDTSGKPLLGYMNRHGGLSTLGIGLDVTFKFWSCFGANLMIGYRWVNVKDPHLDFNGTFFSYGLQVYLGHIIRKTRYAIKRHHTKKEILKLGGVWKKP